MAQVIEVRFRNQHGETLHDCMTLASSHTDAIALALRDWSAGTASVKEVELIKNHGFIPGPQPHWQYQYACVFVDDTADGSDRALLATLFAQYPEN